MGCTSPVSSKQFLTGGVRVRDWLTGQSLADQYEFGMDVLNQSYDYGYDLAGHQTSISCPAAGGLPAETVHTGYSDQAPQRDGICVQEVARQDA